MIVGKGRIAKAIKIKVLLSNMVFEVEVAVFRIYPYQFLKNCYALRLSFTTLH